jgi:hypothetical protein
MFGRITTWILLLCCLVGSAAAAVDGRLEAGRAQMLEGTATGLAQAHRIFDEALQETDGPNGAHRRELVFLHALTRGALLFADHPDIVSADDFFALAEGFGLALTGGTLTGVKAALSCGTEADDAASDAASENGWAGWKALAELSAVIAELDSIADAPTRFVVRFRPDETGLAGEVEVDYGEVLLLKALLSSYRAALEAQVSESLEAAPETAHGDSYPAASILRAPVTNSTTPIDLAGVVERCARDALWGESARPGAPWVGGFDLNEAARPLPEGVTCYLRAIDYIRVENHPAGTDPQEDELLYLEPGAAEQIQSTGARQPTSGRRLPGREVVASDLQAMFAFDLYDGNSACLGRLTLTEDLVSHNAAGGWLIMNDGVVLTVAWMEIGPDNAVAIDLRSRAAWRQVWLEGTFTADRQAIVDGTMDCWGEGSGFVSRVTGRRTKGWASPCGLHTHAFRRGRDVDDLETRQERTSVGARRMCSLSRGSSTHRVVPEPIYTSVEEGRATVFAGFAAESACADEIFRQAKSYLKSYLKWTYIHFEPCRR